MNIAAKEADISKAAAERVLSAIIGAVVKTVSKGDHRCPDRLRHFQVHQARRPYRQEPEDRRRLKIAATTVPKFTAGATFKAAVAGKKAAKKK